MDIFTLVKANIRHRKGTFISIIILMMIIVTSVVSMISTYDNTKRTIADAIKEADSGNLTLFIKKERLTEELLGKVRTHDMVQRVETREAIAAEKARVGDTVLENTWFLEKKCENYKVLDSDFMNYQSGDYTIHQGEIYVTRGTLQQFSCKIGDTITVTFKEREYDFIIKACVVEPMTGAGVMGWKQVFISDEDYERIISDGHDIADNGEENNTKGGSNNEADIEAYRNEEYITKEDKDSDNEHSNMADSNEEKISTQNYNTECIILQIYKSEDCKLSDNQFKRQLNLDTGIVDNSIGAMSASQAIYYTNLFPQIVLSIMMVFVLFLFVIVMIVMGHSITTGIDIDFVNIGVLKALGFTHTRIRIMMAVQYMMAQVIGIIFGMICAIPLNAYLENVFLPIIAIPVRGGINILKSILLIALLLLISGVFILLKTAGLTKISPVRALQGGKEEIYFDSRIKAPISKKGLSFTLAFRQFTSSKRRYISTFIIISILVFFMISINELGNLLDSESAMEESMGEIITNFYAVFKADMSSEDREKIENDIEKMIHQYTGIEKKVAANGIYMSINGEQLYCRIHKYTEALMISKGRAPIYDNEIVITDIVSEELSLKIGDKVKVSHNDKSDVYIVSGIYQSMNDTGRVFAMSYEGGQKLDAGNISYVAYKIKDKKLSEKIVNELNEKYGDILKAEVEEEVVSEEYRIVVDVMKAVIYVFSGIFALVVVSMVCSKMFVKERKDIGIFKAIGFTQSALRMQFAFRFVVAAIIGSVFGGVLSLLFTEKLFNILLRAMGITNFVAEYSFAAFFLPALLVSVCFFGFAYLVSGKVKRVEVRELVTE